MKTFKVALLAVIGVVIAFSSCSKYEEGPAISLLTKKARITGEWEVSDVIVNGTQLIDLSDFAGTMTFEKDGTGQYSQLGISIDIEWEFSEEKEALRTRSNFLGSWSDWTETEILKLENKEFWTTDTELGVTTEVHYTKI
ncbi:MAG: hypothetical protein JXL97_12590 [Bacteroidales bacterium]|nr:hypothetical protein [Bacteroidales bacterium]